MILLNEGDKTKVVCVNCKSIRTAVYQYKDFTLRNGKRIPNVLQAICNYCGNSLSIPAQSTLKIQEAIQEKTHPLEVRIPPILEDVIYSIGHESHLDTSIALKCIIQFYTSKLANAHDLKLGNYLMEIKNNHPLLSGSKKSRVSVKIPDVIAKQIKESSDSLSLNKSEYIVRLLIKAKEDLIENRTGKDAKKFYESVNLFQYAK